MKDKPLTIMMAADMTNGVAYTNWCSVNVGTEFWTPNPYAGGAYGSNWVFDGNTRFSICADYDGTPKLNCIVRNLKIEFTILTDFYRLPFSNKGIEESLLNPLDFFIS